jgi:P27 family predicted phage terminase small subunit
VVVSERTVGSNGTPVAPKHLQPATRAWFARVVSEWALDEHHVRLLQLAASAWDEAEAAREIIAKEGLTVRDRFKQARPHPAVAIQRDARTAFARLMRELDLDAETPPESRPPRRP